MAIGGVFRWLLDGEDDEGAKMVSVVKVRW